MVDPITAELRARMDSLTEQLHSLEDAIPMEALIEQLGDLSARELDALTASKAADYLRSIDDERVRAAYLLISNKIDHDTLAKICLEFLQRPGSGARRAGAFGIGSCLKGTGNIEASHVLAIMVCNPEEETDTRLGAYMSLEVIHGGKRTLTPKTTHEASQAEDELTLVDWSFVESFL